MSKIRANFISSKNDNKAVEFTSGIVVGGAVTATNFDFNAEVYNVGTGASISNPANNVLALGTNNTEKVRITSGGMIGVGNNGSYPIYSATNDRNLILGTGNGNNGIQLHCSTTGYGGVYFGDTDSGQSRYSGYVEYKNNENFLRFATSNTEKVRITSGGEVQIINGNLKFSTAGTGIDFSATSDGSGTTTSELLDDYEEGTFTPNLLLYASGSILETISPLSGSFKGRYTKIGNRVWVEIYARYNLSTITSSAWVQTLIELPFAQGAFGGQQYAPAFIGYYANFLTDPTSSDGNHYFPGGYVGSSTNYLYLTINQMNAAETYIDETNISSSTSAGVMVSANYCTESI